MGEEAPSHPEWVIPTNPAYRSRAQMLLMQAAKSIGLAKGGRYSVSDMAALAKGVGAESPRVMGAIGMAESSGDPSAHGPPDGRGLWQIEWPVWAKTMQARGLGNAYNPEQNAAMMKIVQSMQGLSAWVVYNTGAYKQYLNGKDDGGGGLFSKITGALGSLLSGGAGWLLDKLPGVGSLPDWLQGAGKYALGKAGDWIKDKVGGLLSSVTGGNGGAGLPKGISGSIGDVIALAQGFGFNRPSGGQLTGGKHAPGSYHYQGRAADFGDAGHSPAEMMRLFNAIEARYGAQLKELFYDKSGHYIKNGKVIPGQFGGHGDHIHAALAQGGLFGGAPYQGSFATGGIVGGPTGAPASIIAHGGEVIEPNGAGLIASNNRLAAAIDRLNASRNMDAVGALADVIGERHGQASHRRSMTAGDPGRTAILNG
jgi:hypothetical protein